ncbi:MAG: hypothetical protein ACKORA_00005 [Solirubrobacterales bacterium]
MDRCGRAEDEFPAASHAGHRLEQVPGGPGVRLEGRVNVCSGTGVSVSEVIEAFRRLTEVAIETVTNEGRTGRQEVEAEEVVGSRERVTAATGWEPEVELAESLEAGLEGFRQAGQA